MADLNTVTCDQCTEIKGKSNHWFKAQAGPGLFAVCVFDQKLPCEINPAPDVQVQILHLCSERCVAKELSVALFRLSNAAS